jgi:CHAT domain-containing protein
MVYSGRGDLGIARQAVEDALIGANMDCRTDRLGSQRDLMTLHVPRPPRLVVLSACQTAVHEFQNTPDEVIGLPAGFMRSGVPGVLACLWNVDDLSTALLMARFYELHLQGDPEGPLPPVRALRLAQRWLRDIKAGELLPVFPRAAGAGEAW